jgi:hypothetical protein
MWEVERESIGRTCAGTIPLLPPNQMFHPFFWIILERLPRILSRIYSPEDVGAGKKNGIRFKNRWGCLDAASK